MTTKLKILLIINVIILAISKFLIPVFMLYKMYGATASAIMFYIVAGLLSMWVGPIIGRILLLVSLNNDETKWLKTELLKQELKDESDKEKLECLVCKRMIQRRCMHEHQKTPTWQNKGLLLDITQKEHYHEKYSKQETQKHIMKVQNVNIVPHMLKQVMMLMKSLGLNKMEKDLVDVKNCTNNLCFFERSIK
jgi:uncharacterized membrane protein